MATKTNTTINGRDYYRLQKTVDHKVDKNGKKVPVKKTFYGRSKREAEKKYDLWKEEQIRRKDRKNYNAVPFGDIAEMYCNNVLMEGSYAPGTKKRYDCSYRNWVKTDSVLCSIPICDITALDLQLYFNRLPCSYANKKQVHKFLSAMLKWCVMQGYCASVLDAVEVPKSSFVPKEITIWSEEELNIILSNLASYRNGKYRLRLFIIMAAFTGMRIGELFGLNYKDLQNGIINVGRQIYEGDIRPPKANSYRQIPIAPVLADEIAIHEEWHRHEMKVKKYDSDYVFTTLSGKLLEYGNVRRSLERYYHRINIEPKKFHTYRSTFCTMLCKSGVPIQIASKLLGHKSIEVTAKYYTDVDLSDKAAAISMLPQAQKLSLF